MNLQLTMESGQPPQFIWEKRGGEYFRKWRGKRITTEDVAEELFRLKDPYEKILNLISTGTTMKKAVRSFQGLRLTKSDPWETLVVFLCSSNNNMKRIRRMVQVLMVGGEIPAPEKLARMDLKKAKLGFREKFLQETAGRIASYDLGRMGKLPYADARQQLMELPGVGPKIADCVCLFGLGKTEAFPIDVWIGRAMEKYYGVRKEKKIHEFAAKKWGKWAGYAQQFLFMQVRDERK